MAGTIIFLSGADSFRSREKLRAIKARYIDASLGDTNLAVLDGASVTFPELVRQVQALPFLAKTRLVVITDLLLFGKKEVREATSDFLDKIPASTVVVFYESGLPDKRTALFKRLAKEKLATEYRPLVGPQLTVWVEAATADRGLELAPEARQYLITAVGSDLWRMSSELDKLAAYAASRAIDDWRLAIGKDERDNSRNTQYAIRNTTVGALTPALPLTLAQIRELVHAEASSDVFALIEAIARGRTGEALGAFRTLLSAGEAELYILSMITYQFRTLLIVAEAVASGQSNAYALAKTTGLAPFVVQKTLPLVRGLALSDLVARFRRLLDYDHQIKTGALEPRTALELLIVELSSSTSTNSE